MNNQTCPKCNKPINPAAKMCPSCGVIFAKIMAAENKKRQVHKEKQKQAPNIKTSVKQTAWTSDARINQQLKNLCAFDSFFTRKEIKYLPETIRDDETIQGLGSGTLGGNTWLIVPTDQRLLFLDKGMIYGLKQSEMQYDQISAVTHKIGLLLASISLATSGGKKNIENLQKNDAPFLAEIISKQIRKRQQRQHQPVPPVQPTQPAPPPPFEDDVISQLERLGDLFQKGILTEDEFKIQKAKILGN